VARLKATTFTGASPSEVDPDAPTYKRVLRNAQAEATKLYDQLTGLNAEANTINHSGAGRGCPLGLPLWNVLLRRSLGYTNPDTGAKQASPASIFLVAHPFFLPKGETAFRVELRVSSSFIKDRATVVVTSTGGVVQFRAPLQFRANVIGNMRDGYFDEIAYADISGLTANTAYLIYVEYDTLGTGVAANIIESWSAYYIRNRVQTEPSDLSGGSEFTLDTVSATLAHTDMDELLFADFVPISGYLTTKIAQNIARITEFVTGRKVGASYQLADSGVSNPTTSGFHAGTRSAFALEGEVDFPLWTEPFGAFGTNTYAVVNTGVTPPVRGLMEWFAPYPLTIGPNTIRKAKIGMPDFQTSSSRLKAIVMFATSQSADITNWSCNLLTGSIGGFVTNEPLNASFAAYSGVTTQIALAEFTALPFTSDVPNEISIQVQRDAGVFDAARDEIFLLGICLYFQP
jgi:hypothetical protein